MIGKSMMEYRFGPVARPGRASSAGRTRPSSPIALDRPHHRSMAMDAWVSIPFMMILLLAGLQALPKEVQEAAKVDGATGWQGFWQITFPLMLPVSRHRHRAAHHLQAEARRHRHQRHRRAARAAPPTRCRASSSASTATARTSATAPCWPRSISCIIIIFVTLLLKFAQPLHAEDDLMAADERPDHRIRRSRHRARRPACRRPRLHLWRADLLGLHLRCSRSTGPSPPRSRSAKDVHAGPPHPLGRLPAGLAGLALARPVARHDLRRPRRCATSSSSASATAIITSLGASILAVRHRLARRLRPQPLPLQVRLWMRNKDISLLLPVAADPAAGRARHAVPRSLQGTGAARHARSASSCSTR